MDSEDKSDISRRTFIVGVSAGVVGTACSSNKGKEQPAPSDDAAKAPAPSPREAAMALCLMIGPWAAADRADAEEFLDRFLSADRLAGFSKHADAIATLPNHLPNAGSQRLDKIPLAELSAAEREALVEVLGEIYDVEEVRYYVAKEPNSGTCMNDLSFIATVPT